MKQFKHEWTGEIFLLHIQLTNCPDNKEIYADITIKKNYEGQKEIAENKKIELSNNSHRFIVSRTHPKEKSVTILYPENIILEAFLIDDRAYYPTESFYKN